MDNIITIALHAFLWGAIVGKAVATEDILKRTRWGIFGVLFGLYAVSVINTQAGILL